MTQKLENQLAQVIVYLGAIDSLAAASRDDESLQQDVFLFDTVYSSLWDAAVIRIGTIWDKTKGVASLPKLADLLNRSNYAGTQAIAKNIRKATSPEWLKRWRHDVVAHVKFRVDADSFDSNYGIAVEDLRKEAERIEQLLGEINRCLGRPQTFYDVLKSDARANAGNSLARWKRGVN